MTTFGECQVEHVQVAASLEGILDPDARTESPCEKHLHQGLLCQQDGSTEEVTGLQCSRHASICIAEIPCAFGVRACVDCRPGAPSYQANKVHARCSCQYKDSGRCCTPAGTVDKGLSDTERLSDAGAPKLLAAVPTTVHLNCWHQ